MKTTPWFPGTVKPVRVGVYQRKYPNDAVMYCYWNGFNFYAGEATAYAAVVYKFYTFKQDLPWRGLTEKASGADIGGAK